AGRILREDRIQDGVGDLIGHLVGMPFGDRFAAEGKCLLGHRLLPGFDLGLCRRCGHEYSTSDESPTFRRWYAPRTTAFSPTTELSSKMSLTFAPSFRIEFRTTAWRSLVRGPIETCGPITAAETSAVGSIATGG